MFKRLLKKQRGFSLLEIMVAVAILATSFVVLLSSQGGSFNKSERAQDLSEATLLARMKMAEIQIELEKDLAKNKFPETDKKESGIFEDPFENYRWDYSIKKVEIPVAEPTGEESQNAMIANELKTMMEEIGKRVREVRLHIVWGDKNDPPEKQPSMEIVTHIVKLN
ncbi:type II secretion system GspH family protein [bacterium]|nr:type II secretion system GspH family protein [bacterium]